MVRHLITSACFVLPAAGLVAYAAWRCDRVAKAKNFLIAAPVLLVVICIMSVGAVTRTVPCPDNAIELCTYNDSVPSIVTLVAVFVVASGIRGWFSYAER
jgi:hypothetical protein